MAAITQAADDEDGDAMILRSHPPPQDILDEILQILNDYCCRRQDERHQIEEIHEAKSAQQQVYILRFALVSNGDSSKDLQEPKDHRQEPPTHQTYQQWTEALESGRNRLVLRLWKGGSQWWNLHRNASPVTLARQEIMGYRAARTAFMEHSNSKRRQRQHPRIPRVLRFLESSGECTPSVSIPWAVLEYVGPDSSHLETSQLDSSYLDGMVKVRTEFGFEEPHPRWGRVPVDQALEYARVILHQVMLPLHKRTRRQSEEFSHASNSARNNNEAMMVHTYASMVNVYKSAVPQSMASLESKIHKEDAKTAKCLSHLNGALDVLESNCRSVVQEIPQISPVLLHMDLQPQNLIFYKRKPEITMDRCQDNNTHDDSSRPLEKDKNNQPTVSAVLDWEDAAWADPRFDLLLLCRKVCANRDQANILWSEYANAVSTNGENNETVALGPIEPWLQLESVHNTITLLLQSMDLLNGGRNPWETNTDLWRKLERELVRWEGYTISS